MAAMTAPARAAAQHQSLLHFVGQAPWSDAAVLIKVRDLVLPAIERAGAIEAWVIDDPGFPKKGGTRWGWRVSIAASSALRRLRQAVQRSARAVLQVELEAARGADPWIGGGLKPITTPSWKLALRAENAGARARASCLGSVRSDQSFRVTKEMPELVFWAPTGSRSRRVIRR